MAAIFYTECIYVQLSYKSDNYYIPINFDKMKYSPILSIWATLKKHPTLNRASHFLTVKTTYLYRAVSVQLFQIMLDVANEIGHFYRHTATQ